jgi:hypothetical protein
MRGGFSVARRAFVNYLTAEERDDGRVERRMRLRLQQFAR